MTVDLTRLLAELVDRYRFVEELAAEFGLPPENHADILRAAKARDGAGGTVRKLGEILHVPPGAPLEMLLVRAAAASAALEEQKLLRRDLGVSEGPVRHAVIRLLEHTGTPRGYVCSRCGAAGCKLWKRDNAFESTATLSCHSCLPENFSRVGLQPAIPTEVGTGYWAYTSAPEGSRAWWDSLPDAPVASPGPPT